MQVKTQVVVASLLGLASFGACATTPAPLWPGSAGNAPEALSVATDHVQHSLLPTVVVDTKDGLALDEVTVLAVLVNPDLRAARAERGVATAQVVQAGVLPNPDLSLGIDFPAFGAIQGATASESLGLTWDVTSLITRDPQVRAGQAHLQEVELDIAWQEWRVAIEARLEWRRLDALERELVLVTSTEADLRTLAETLERAQKTHDTTSVETSAARSALDETTLARMGLERERGAARVALNRLLGLRADSQLRLQPATGPDARPLPPRADLESGLPERRLDLVALRWGYESEEQLVRAAVLTRMPRLGLDVGASRDNAGLGAVGLNVTIGLPVFDRAQGRVGVERATRARLREEYDARVFAAHADLAEAFIDFESARAALAAAEQTIPRLEQLVVTYRQALAEHLVSVPNLYDAIAALNARRLEALRRRRELGDLLTAIELASGRLLSPVPEATP